MHDPKLWSRDAAIRRVSGITSPVFAASGFFAIDGIHRYRWTIDLTIEQVRGLFSTFSNWMPDEVRAAADAMAALGGSVTEHYTSWLIPASRAE